jgi:hypothetical protein
MLRAELLRFCECHLGFCESDGMCCYEFTQDSAMNPFQSTYLHCTICPNHSTCTHEGQDHPEQLCSSCHWGMGILATWQKQQCILTSEGKKLDLALCCTYRHLPISTRYQVVLQYKLYLYYIRAIYMPDASSTTHNTHSVPVLYDTRLCVI